MTNQRIPIFVCVGTMKHILDSVAPRVGTILQNKGYVVIGTENNQIHAKNVHNIPEYLKYFDTKTYEIIGVDATYSKKQEKIILRDTPLRPGAGVGKNLPEIGEKSIGINIMFKAKNKSVWSFWHKMIFTSKKDEQLVTELVKETVKYIESNYKNYLNKEDGIEKIS